MGNIQTHRLNHVKILAESIQQLKILDGLRLLIQFIRCSASSLQKHSMPGLEVI